MQTAEQPGRQGRRESEQGLEKKQPARTSEGVREEEKETERMQEQAASSLPSSSERSSSSAHHMEMELKEGMESDEEIRRVPELGLELLGGASTSGRAAGGAQASAAAAQASGRRRVRSPADKEHKRLKRLLRNRVSAQQARERKKAYLTDLEVKVNDLEKKNSEMEEKLSTLQNENQMLRQILKNTTVSRRGPGSTASGEGQ